MMMMMMMMMSWGMGIQWIRLQEVLSSPMGQPATDEEEEVEVEEEEGYSMD